MPPCSGSGAAIIFAAADWRLLIPLLIWLAAYIGALLVFVPRIKERSTEAAEARSMLVGRIVDSYTNILTVKLFAHAEREDAYARSALEEQMGEVAGLAAPRHHHGPRALLAERPADGDGHRAGHLAVERRRGSRVGDIAVVTGLVLRIIGMSGWILWVVAGIFENIGVVQEGMETISRANQVVDRPDSKPLVVSRGDIRFDDVSFHYGQQLAPARAPARRGRAG